MRAYVYIPVLGELGSIGQQVQHDLAKPQGIGIDRLHILRYLNVNAIIVLPSQMLSRDNGIVQQCFDLDMLGV